MQSSFNLPPGCTQADCDGPRDDSTPIVCDGCGHAKQSTRYIRTHGAELCAACDAQWTSQTERDKLTLRVPPSFTPETWQNEIRKSLLALCPNSPNFENSIEAFLMRD